MKEILNAMQNSIEQFNKETKKFVEQFKKKQSETNSDCKVKKT